MNAVPLPLLPVGRDCDCGFPLVWYGDRQRCSVYGTHAAPAQPIHYKGAQSTGVARLIHDINAVPCPASRSIASRNARARKRNQRIA